MNAIAETTVGVPAKGQRQKPPTIAQIRTKRLLETAATVPANTASNDSSSAEVDSPSQPNKRNKLSNSADIQCPAAPRLLSAYPPPFAWQPLANMQQPASPLQRASAESPISTSVISELKGQIASLHGAVDSLKSTITALQSTVTDATQQISSRTVPSMTPVFDSQITDQVANMIDLQSVPDAHLATEYLRRTTGQDTMVDAIMTLMRYRIKHSQIPASNKRFAAYTNAVLPNYGRDTLEEYQQRFEVLRKQSNMIREDLADRLTLNFNGLPAASMINVLPSVTGYITPSTDSSSLHHVETEMRALAHKIEELSQNRY